jgi:hypothetical protein
MIRSTALVLVTLAAFGCSSSGRIHTNYAYNSDADPVTNRPVHITQGPMPDGESFTGSYHSQQIGDLYLEQMGDIVTGQYEYDRAACHATGRVEGRVTGNLMRFTWTESQAACGRLQPLTGHGYFLFWKETTDDGAVNERLNGEWGVGDNDSGGGPWSAFRDRVRRQPPSQSGNATGGGVFEDANGSSGGTSSGGSSGGSSSGGRTP